MDMVAIAAKHAYSLCRTWLPHGELRGSEWFALNPTRNDKTIGSFSVKVAGEKAGYWNDFATGDAGQNMVSLYCYINKINPEYKDEYKKAIMNVKELVGYADQD